MARKKETLTEDVMLKAAGVLAKHGWSPTRRLRNTGSMTLAAKAAGVPLTTAYEWTKNPKFLAMVEEIQARLVERFIDNLVNASCSGDTTATIFGLKNLRPDLFDDQLRRQIVRQAHEKEMLEAKREEVEQALTRIHDVYFQEASAEDLANLRLSNSN